MESIIKVLEGSKLKTRKCFFCNKEAVFTFGIVDNTKTIKTQDDDNSFIMNHVTICKAHAEAFNSLLSGEHDIEYLIKLTKTNTQNKINLRR